MGHREIEIGMDRLPVADGRTHGRAAIRPDSIHR